MRRGLYCAAVFVAVVDGLVCGAAKAAILTFDTSGDVTLSTSPSPGSWYPDRYPPLAFLGAATAPDGRPGTLQVIIGASDSLANRPPPYDSAFYNTQGRKLDLPPDTTGLLIDLYIPHDWDSLPQSQNPGRLASLWATGLDASGNALTFPIIEFNNNVDGASTNDFRLWDSFAGSWGVVSGFGGYDRWYEIGFTVGGGQEQFFVNGTLVGTIPDPTTTHLANVILQGYNAGDTYDIYWDNLDVNPTPEPSTLAIFGIGAAGMMFIGWRRKRRSA